MALAPRTVQNMPEGLRREPITVLQPASITPEPTNRFWAPGILDSAYQSTMDGPRRMEHC